MKHYFTDDDKDKGPLRHDIVVRFDGEELSFLSAEGMFSKDRLDTGSRLLIEESELPSAGSVLDLGCGIGVVGILVLKREPALTVVQSDVTEKAVRLTKQNAQKHHVQTRVVQGNCYEALQSETFDVILTNPPRAAGKEVIRRMIEEAPAHLTDGGSLQLVAMTNKGGETYAKIMKETFGNVETIARGSGFKIYKSVRQPV